MTISRLKSGRFRAQVWDRRSQKWVAVADVIGPPRSFASVLEAQAAKYRAQQQLGSAPGGPMTLGQFWEIWTTDPLYERPKESTNKHYRERTKGFVERYGDVPIALIGDSHVSAWLAGGKRNGTVQELRVMFNDAMSAKAGRVIHANPFAALGLSRQRGNKYRQPPSAQAMVNLTEFARGLTPPSFAAWLEVACYTAMRPGELDAMRWSWLNWEAGDIHVREQWNHKIGRFTEPKYGPYDIALVRQVRETLTAMKHDSDGEFCFTTLRGRHYTPSTRIHHWNRVRVAAGMPNMTMYLATRHHFAWFALNVLSLPAHVVAQQLGHRDGGRLISELYGHPDAQIARQRIRDAYENVAKVSSLRSRTA